MKLEEIGALSNKELRMKAAEILGITDIKVRYLPVPWLMDLCEDVLSGYSERSLVAIADYPNDIAAAWELEKISSLNRTKYSQTLLDVLFGEQKVQGFASALEISFLAEVNGEELAWTLAHALPIDRTRAFILVMTQEEGEDERD